MLPAPPARSGCTRRPGRPRRGSGRGLRRVPCRRDRPATGGRRCGRRKGPPGRGPNTRRAGSADACEAQPQLTVTSHELSEHRLHGLAGGQPERGRRRTGDVTVRLGPRPGARPSPRTWQRRPSQPCGVDRTAGAAGGHGCADDAGVDAKVGRRDGLRQLEPRRKPVEVLAEPPRPPPSGTDSAWPPTRRRRAERGRAHSTGVNSSLEIALPDAISSKRPLMPTRPPSSELAIRSPLWSRALPMPVPNVSTMVSPSRSSPASP